MCWHMCNNCNGESTAHPCIMFVPTDDASGLTGCPYHVHGEENEESYPACWIAITAEEAKGYIEKKDWFRADDEEVDEFEYEMNKESRKRLLEGE